MSERSQWVLSVQPTEAVHVAEVAFNSNVKAEPASSALASPGLSHRAPGMPQGVCPTLSARRWAEASMMLLNTFCTAGMLIRKTGRTVVASETSRWHADSSNFS